MFSTATLRRLALLPFLLLPSAGCDSQDDNLAGNGGSGGTDAETFQQQAILTFDTVNGVVAGVDEVAHGDFSQIVSDLGFPVGTARAADEFLWDSLLQAWVLDTSGREIETTETGTTTMDYDIYAYIQFRDASGAAQQDPDSSTVALTLDMDWYIDLVGVENGETIEMILDYDSYLDVAGLPDGPYEIDGTGGMSGSIDWSAGPDQIYLEFGMGWAMDLEMPDNDGCPTGTMTVSVDQFEATATYNGTTSYSWQMTEHGRHVSSGSEPFLCGAPLSGPAPVRAWDRWSALRP